MGMPNGTGDPDPVGTSGAEADEQGAEPVIVKKYANRRLYNTETSSYITLDNLAEMVRTGRDFIVYDAKSGDDITRGVLTQIIVEEEGRGRAMLPTGFLRHLINFYGGNVDHGLPGYLERSMEAFARQQAQMQRAMQSMGMVFPFSLEEVGRQNLAMMERAITLFAPGGQAVPHSPPAGTGPQRMDPSVSAGVSEVAPERLAETQLAQLRAELDALRRQLADSQAIFGATDPSQADAELARPPAARVQPVALDSPPPRLAVDTAASRSTLRAKVVPETSRS